MKGFSMVANKGIMVMFSLVLVLLAFTGCASQSGTNGTQGNTGASQSPTPATTSGGSSVSKEPFRFGASVPLTGSFATYSKYFKNGLDLAVEEVNKSGGVNGRMLEVIYEDHKGEPSTGISTLQKMITKDKVNTVFLTMTGVAMAQLPIGDQSKVVMLTGAVTYPKYATSSEWAIQDSISVYSEAQRMVGYITDKVKAKSVALIYENSELGKIYSDEFKKSIGDKAKITSMEAFDLKGTDFRGQITKAMAGNPEGVTVHGTGQELQIIFKQLREQGYKGAIFSTSTTETSNTMTISGSAAEGIVYTFNSLDESQPYVKAFIDKYKAKYNEDPEIFAAQHYELVMMLADILKRGKDGAQDIRDGFLNIKNFKGITGDINFDKDGLVAKPLQLKVVKNGKFELLEK